MANRMGFLVISFVLFSRGIHTTAGKECKFEHKYVCGLQDCNCRYISENGVSVSSLYERFVAMFSIPSSKGQVCDKCDVFCSEEKHINCHHGACDKQKGCICRDCWTGETCSKYDNRQPEFKQSLYVAEIKEDTNVGDEIIRVSAFDYDLEKCVDKHNCPCGYVKYSIKKGTEDGSFYINSDTGVISLTRKLYDQYDPISLTILAKNEGDLNTVEDNQNDKAMATVIIITVENYTDARKRRSLHHRTRRSVTYDALVSTFEAETNETFFDANSQINYRLYLTQNQSASPHNLSSIRIQLSSENLQLGHGYSVNISNVIQNISYDNSGNIVEFRNLGIQINATDYMEIKFNASVRATSHPLALLQVAFIMNATAASGPVTYGPKYSPELYTTYPLITFARTTEGVVKAGTILDYNANVTLPNFNFSLMLVITTILNDFRFLNIENVQVSEVSNSVQADNRNPTPMKYTRTGDNITSRVVLDFGNIKILNKDQNANTIKLSFSVKVNDHHMLENASIHWIGVGSHVGSDMLGVTQDFIQISKNEPFLFAEIKALNSTDPLVKEYLINDEVQFSWKVQHGNGSYETAENVTVEFYFPKSVVNLVSSASWHENGSIKNETNGSEGSVLTFTPAGNNLPIGNTLSGILVVKVSENVTPLADLNVVIKIRYQTSKGEARPIKTYKPDPGYLAGLPSFSVLTNSSIINIGQIIEVTLKMTVERMTLYGNLFVYLPQRNDSVIMRFVTSESFTTNTGKNIKYSNFPKAGPTYNSTIKNTSYYDSAEFNLGFIRNVNNSNVDNVDNTITLTFKIVLEDNDYVEDLTNYSVNIGMKSSEQAVWISQLAFTANVSLNRRPRLQIIALSNGTDSLVQGSVVEYNLTISHKENSDAHATDVEVIWMLPVYTTFLNVNNKSHQLSSKSKDNNVIFTLSKLDFGEKPFVSFSVAMDPKKVRTKLGKNYAVTPVALTYKNKQTYFEPLVPMVVAFTVSAVDSTEPPTTAKPSDHASEFYHRGYLVDNSSSPVTVYMCAVSSKRDKPSCFWTTSNGETWQAVHVSVINIIGIDTNKIIYGIGNDRRAYMKYVETANEGKWHSILPDVWKKANETLPGKKVVTIEAKYAHESDPEIEKQIDIGNGEKWGANKLGVFHLPSSNGQWTRKACWDCLC